MDEGKTQKTEKIAESTLTSTVLEVEHTWNGDLSSDLDAVMQYGSCLT